MPQEVTLTEYIHSKGVRTIDSVETKDKARALAKRIEGLGNIKAYYTDAGGHWVVFAEIK